MGAPSEFGFDRGNGGAILTTSYSSSLANPLPKAGRLSQQHAIHHPQFGLLPQA
jgi:hypothetical protein